jgi:hypothetical protein
MTSGWPQDQRDRRRPAAGSDDTGPLARRRGRLATETGPQTPVTSDGSEFSTAHPSGPLPVGPMPQPPGRAGRGRSRGDGGTDSYGLSDADYDWIRYLGEAGPAQGSAPGNRAADTARADAPPLPHRRGPDRRTGELPGRAAALPGRAGELPGRGGELPGRSVSTPRQGAVPDATGYVPRTHRRESGPSRREAAPAPWSADGGWPTTAPAPSEPRAAETLTRPGSGPFTRPSVRPAERAFVEPAKRPSGWPAEPAVGPAPRPDDGRPRGSGHSGATHRRARATVETDREIARSPVKESRTGLRNRRDARRRAAVQQAAPPDTEPAPSAAAVQTVTKDTAVAGPITAQPKAPTKRAARARARRRHRTLVRVIGLVAAVAVVPATAAGVLRSGLFRSSGPDHTITVPAKLLGFTQQAGLAKGMNAQALRADIVRKSSGEATHVVDGVYEANAGSGTTSSPLIILFIGGNLSGSASSFISSFTGMMPGAYSTSAGKLGGLAACVPGTAGRPAECAWADNDTFGLFASPALSAAALGKDMRSMRPLVEHRAKGA